MSWPEVSLEDTFPRMFHSNAPPQAPQLNPCEPPVVMKLPYKVHRNVVRPDGKIVIETSYEYKYVVKNFIPPEKSLFASPFPIIYSMPEPIHSPDGDCSDSASDKPDSSSDCPSTSDQQTKSETPSGSDIDFALTSNCSAGPTSGRQFAKSVASALDARTKYSSAGSSSTSASHSVIGGSVPASNAMLITPPTSSSASSSSTATEPSNLIPAPIIVSLTKNPISSGPDCKVETPGD